MLNQTQLYEALKATTKTRRDIEDCDLTPWPGRRCSPSSGDWSICIDRVDRHQVTFKVKAVAHRDLPLDGTARMQTISRLQQLPGRPHLGDAEVAMTFERHFTLVIPRTEDRAQAAKQLSRQAYRQGRRLSSDIGQQWRTVLGGLEGGRACC